MSDSRDSLGTRTLRGMFWAYASFGAVRLASLITTAILARILLPRDFGLVALAMTFMAFLDMLQGLGVGDALVIGDAANSEADTAFVVGSGTGIVLWLLAAALGPAAAALFHEPRLVVILPVLGATFAIRGLSGTHYALALKEIDFRTRTEAEIGDALLRAIVGVVLALAGAGVWSLIGGYLAGNLAMAIILWRRMPWRPRLRIVRSHLRRLLGFGGALTGVGLMGAFLSQFDNGVIGRVLGPTQLGFYSIANRLPYLFIISLAAASGQVLYPSFAALQTGALGRGFLLALRYTAAVAFPLTATLIALARPLTIAAFGPQWRPAVTATQVMCLWALMSPVSMVCGNALKARGRAVTLLLLAIPQAIVLVIGSLVLARQGIVAVAWVQAGIAIVAQVVTLTITARMLKLNASAVLRAILPPLVAALMMAGALVISTHLIIAIWPNILLGGTVGVAVYLAASYVLMPELFAHFLRIARPRSQPSPDPAPKGNGGSKSSAPVATLDSEA